MFEYDSATIFDLGSYFFLHIQELHTFFHIYTYFMCIQKFLERGI